MSTSTNLVKNLMPDVSPASVMWANFVAPIFDRSEPHIRSVPLHHVETLEELLGFADITGSFRGGDLHLLEATAPDATFLAQWRPHSSHGSVMVRAARAEDADKAEAEVSARRPPVPVTETSARLDFWQVDGTGDPYTVSRAIDAPTLADVTGNYPGEVWDGIDQLRGLEPSLDDGRIVLWHGPPGTGKTTAVRALARAWGGRIRVQVLLDPERVLSGSAVLMSVLLDESTDGWRLLVIEDADELLRADAKERVGQSLSRLLNVSDGLLGQGSKVLVLVTTNEPIGRIHPALVRPGRCLQETRFRRFTRAEATRFTPRPLPPGQSFSLAELSAIDGGRAVEPDDGAAFGTYL